MAGKRSDIMGLLTTLPQRLRIRSQSNYKWYVLGAIMLGTIMGPLDGSIANVALATIGRAFRTSVDNVEWVLLAYLLISASTLVLFGRIGDMIGQKRVYLVGFAIFGLSSIACAFAPSLWAMVGARVVQGVGAAMLLSSTPAIIVHTFPASERGRAIGFNGGAVAVGLTAGPVVGGLIVTYSDWRWIFLINVPISIVALALATIILKPEGSRPAKFDFAGAAIASSALFALTLPLSRVHIWGLTSPATIGLLVYFIIASVVFIEVERRAEAPMLDLALFRDRVFAFSVVAATLYFSAVFAVIFVIPVAAQTALDRNALEAGLMLLPISVLNIVLAPIAGALSDKVPARYISTIGSSIFCVGALLLALLPAKPLLWMIPCALLIAGCGTAVFSQPNNSTIMGRAPSDKRGVAAGVLATARSTGQVLGIASASAIYFTVAKHADAHTFIPAKAVFAVVAVVLVFVSLISFTRD
jgi:EmrB/QacA subfamily drug resistance transporter